MTLREWGRGIITWLKETLHAHRVAEAFVLGIVLSALFNPIIVPPIQDWAEAEGLFGPPRPDIHLQYSNSTSTGYMEEQAGVDLSDQRYRTFFIEIKNPTNKLITELNVALAFHGCAHSVDIWQTSLDSVFFSHSAEEVDTGFLRNDSCIATIDIEELPPNHMAEIFVVTDLERENKNFEEADRLDPFEAAVYVNYEWEYNERTYFESGNWTDDVTDRMTGGDLFR